MRIPSLVAAAFALFLQGAPAHAQTVDSEWRAALQSGSPRLVLFSILKEQPAGALGFAQDLLRRNGLDPAARDGLRHLSFSASVAPTLEWDGNINGGTPGDSFFLGDFEFIVDADSRALSGVLAGFGSTITSRTGIGYGHLLDLSLSAALAHAPQHDITRISGQASACGTFRMVDWVWLDTCGRLQYLQSDDRAASERSLGMGVTRVFGTGLGSHELRGGVDLQLRDGYAKTVAQLDLSTVRAGLGALALGIDLGERIEGSNTLLYGLTASLARPVLGQNGSVALGWSRLGGADFFLQEREDDLLTLRISRRITEGLTGTIGLTRRDSTVALYDESALYVGVSLAGLSF